MNAVWKRVFLWLVLAKVVYLGLVYFGLRLWPSMDEGRFQSFMQRWPREGRPVFASHFATWDATHYLYLSEVGYAKDVPSCAFYPLWPLLIRGVSHLTGGSHLIAGMLLANALSLAAWFIFHQLVAARFGETVAKWALVILVVFPGSLFYQFIYSEPLFLLLVMVLWLGLERPHYGWAWTAALLLPLSRGVGVFCVLPIAWHCLARAPLQRREWFGRLESKHSHTTRAAVGKCEGTAETAALLSLMVAPLLGWAAYLALMWHWTGNPFEGFEAQKYWVVHSLTNLVNVPKFVVGLFNPTTWHEFTGSLLDRCMFILLLYTLPVQWRLGKDLLVWTYVLGILPAMSGTFTSFTRFESTAFPMFIALAVFFLRLKKRWPLLVFISTCAILHGVLLWRFVNFRWAG